MQIKLVIVIEGGLVQAVYADTDAQILAAIQDFDTDGADPDELARLTDGREFLGHIELAQRLEHKVQAVFAALGHELPEPNASQADFLEQKGLKCPACGDTALTKVTPGLTSDPMLVVAETVCDGCGASWKEAYRLSGFFGLAAA